MLIAVVNSPRFLALLTNDKIFIPVLQRYTGSDHAFCFGQTIIRLTFEFELSYCEFCVRRVRINGENWISFLISITKNEMILVRGNKMLKLKVLRHIRSLRK